MGFVEFVENRSHDTQITAKKTNREIKKKKKNELQNKKNTDTALNAINKCSTITVA